MTAKEIAREVLAQLPDDCSLEDIEYHLYVRRQLQEAEADPGELIDHEEVEKMIDQWLSE